ncbi:unnamed protein product [Cylindrotheca closterium]|uniref:Uncharacterized protein n=1 Tax=Cylindrotheca closterium TaxID=2856 RepID=A0AAD2JLT5_9STRA|nr:unnamed protein product [Cylindrotheca closterium]
MKSQLIEISGGYILNQATQLNHLAANEFQLQNNSDRTCLRKKPRIGLDFVEQVSFFRSIDILVASHGAQLTGVAFKNARCSHLVELFPKGYAIPDFFGSLAINSGKKYSYLYMSENSFRTEQSVAFADRRQARSVNLCPSPSMMTSILGELSDSWRTCCEEK